MIGLMEMDIKFEKTMELVCRLEEEVKLAKENLMIGISPYISLHFAETLAQEAKREWHTQKSKE